ncbi:ABC-2 type transporter-domain-containing protein [Schizophyllum amplum]|uniref:ABC-2 type transporter-domain-containing protein n=1 Tax=Schizophyllum amplum TaxID=97359 RepID=A0A550CJZ2_9AGAR|nr:ABC-2 type transporter-domain-containing protein [Auriculariopsis ampla]
MNFTSTVPPAPMSTTALKTDHEDPEFEVVPDSYDEGQREGRVHELARQMSHLSRTNSEAAQVNPFIDNSDPRLDPNNPQFNSRLWTKTLVSLASRDPEHFPRRAAGVSFKNLNVHGFGTPTDYQKDVGNVLLSAFGSFKRMLGFGKDNVQKIQILEDFDGLVKSGELLVVLGRPGSGCSTFLKTVSGDTHGFYVDENSDVQYQGISWETMHKRYRGEVIYNAETEVHFPHLTVGDTLLFAAKARTPRTRIGGITRVEYARHMRDVVMTMYGLSHTINTRVGNDFIRGVSGGERKRVSIAETTLAAAPLQCWDNSTRGLDSATALEFIRTLRLQTEFTGSTALVAIYQASQSAYDIFDKVIVLYEGRQIYFGRTTDAKDFFLRMGFECPERQTTGDFLTSLTNPAERVVRPGFEKSVPRTAAEFAQRWKESPERQQLLADIDAHNAEYPLGGENFEQFERSRRSQQSKSLSTKSPYTLSISKQIQLCMERGYQRLMGDMTNFYVTVFGNFVMALIIASVFFNMQPNTDTFYRRGALLFFAVLTNAFSSMLEMLTLYAQRPIVEKHSRYALYHPFSEAIASMICDLPSKIITSLAVNLTLYFMSNLRREPGPFFLYQLFAFTCTLTMSMIFRTIASSTRTLAQAMPPASVFMLALVIYTGFTIPIRDMVVWFRWINYINPIGYAFETLMVNEFDGRVFDCSAFVPSGPGYENLTDDQFICATTGAMPGSRVVYGRDYVNTTYGYYRSHVWRNFGILIGFMVFFCATHLLATEKISARKSKGEVLVFRRGHLPKRRGIDPEAAAGGEKEAVTDNNSVGSDRTVAAIQRQTKTFHWNDVCYDIKIKKEDRRLLNHVDGWVKPGTLTALMGVSGAGKTTLLDVLATRTTMGVITGEMLVNGHPRDRSFQRKTGYVQQQDLHLETSTVREALIFSALLRQPKEVPRDEKIAYVDEVIKLLEMETYAEAVVGVPGEGLNVEQRKRLTIGVELVAKPELLLFFDEPTSGLDSQTAWSICQLMRKLANNGQAILCTIHQPSAILMQEFDRLLFLARGGKTVYFGDLGSNLSTLTAYFERNGAHQCPPDANPAEWMLEVIGAAPGHTTDIDWTEVWRSSPEYRSVKNELAHMKSTLSQIPDDSQSSSTSTFAAPFSAQLALCFRRAWEQTWRTPSYIFSKILLSTITTLFIGFSFYMAENSLQGLQNQMFSIFMLFTIFNNVVQQIHPQFVTQRALYEARERPSKTYSWQSFILSQILVELPWQVLGGVIVFFCWYYPIGLYRNAVPTDAVAERGGLMFLFVLAFFLFTSTFAHLSIVASETAEAGSNLAQLCFSLCLLFCGVLATRPTLGWWIWLNRVSPFTYLVGGMLPVGVANTEVHCSDIEFITVQPPSGQTCGDYLNTYITMAGSDLQNPDATSDCTICSVSSTNAFLAQLDLNYDDRWMNFGIMWVYIFVNIAGAIGFYYLARVPKGAKAKEVNTVEAQEEAPAERLEKHE